MNKNSDLNFHAKLKLFTTIALLATTLSCAPAKEGKKDSSSTTDPTPTPVETPKYLYVSAGVCYSGNNTTFTNASAINKVYRVNASTGVRDIVIADFRASPSNPGDSPASIVNIDSKKIAVLVENTTTTSLRRIEFVEKKQAGARNTFSNNTTALSAQLRSMVYLPSKDFLIARTTGIEFLTSANARVGAPYVNPSVAPCASSNTIITRVLTMSNGKIMFLHATANQNRIGSFTTAGGTTCTSVQQGPTSSVSAFPTSAFYDAANSKLIVAYAGNAVTTDFNSIYAYPVTESSGVIGAGVKIYDAANYPSTQNFLLYGISAMTYDADKKEVYVATAINTNTTVTNYAIEKFTYDPTQIGVDNTKVLTRIGTTPFIPYEGDTQCISDMFVAE